MSKPFEFDYLHTPTAAKMHVTMPDGSVWAVPVQLIVDGRDEHYSDEKEDTIGFIRRGSLDPDNIQDWAANYMNWEDVAHAAVRVDDPITNVDYQEGWVNGDKEIVGEI